jgi:signal transduction histidine kinase
MSAPRRRSSSLLIRLLVAYLLPTLVLLGLFGWLAHRATERSLEESLGRRLQAVAQAAATQIRPEAVLFLAPGDDDSRTSRRLRHKLKLLQQRTRVARLVVLDRRLRALSDTRGTMRIGERYYNAEADRPELGRVFSGQEASSVLFTGDGGRIYKTGYAPVLQAPDRVVAAVGAEGSAEYFTVLARLRTRLLASGAVVALLVVLVTLLLARRITRPLRSLAREARRMGAGQLERPVQVTSRDEVGLLAATMNEMREGLYRRDQQLQMMLGGIAHEVRNPLGGIELFSGLLRDELQEQPEKLEKLDRIERELAYLKKVVEDFLDFARNRPPDRTDLDLSTLVVEAAELMARDAEARGVALSAQCSPTPARCDPQQLRRVLLNLTRNAIQATDEGGGSVVLRCLPDGDGALLEVRDDGRGIPAEDLPRIFDPFFSSREKGTGLGLALANKIVEDHGGSVEVQSEEGQGSLFRVRLPAP